MSEQTPPRIEFPCEYPVKIVGDGAPDFLSLVEEIVEHHAAGFARERTTMRHSSGGRYISVTVTIMATGIEQLQALFDELKATGRVQIVL